MACAKYIDGDGAMEFDSEVQEGLEKERYFVVEGRGTDPFWKLR